MYVNLFKSEGLSLYNYEANLRLFPFDLDFDTYPTEWIVIKNLKMFDFLTRLWIVKFYHNHFSFWLVFGTLRYRWEIHRGANFEIWNSSEYEYHVACILVQCTLDSISTFVRVRLLRLQALTFGGWNVVRGMLVCLPSINIFIVVKIYNSEQSS